MQIIHESLLEHQISFKINENYYITLSIHFLIIYWNDNEFYILYQSIYIYLHMVER